MKEVIMYTVKEIADIFRVNQGSIYNMLCKTKGYGEFPVKHFRVGSHIRFLKKDVDKFLYCDKKKRD